MAISTDSAIEFFGDETTVSGTTAAVNDGAFSVSGDVNLFTNTDDAPSATLILETTFSVAPSANTSVDLFARLFNIQSTNDQEAPTANYQHVFLGSFPVKDITTIQRTPIQVVLPNVVTQQQYEFYIRNNAGQTIPLGWALYIRPKTIGPHP